MTAQRTQAPSATVQTLLGSAGAALRESARRHKAASAAHRRAAIADMQALERLARECAHLGIAFEVQSQPDGGTDG